MSSNRGSKLTHKRLVELLDWSPIDGALRWRKTGEVAGTLTEAGYIRIQIDGKGYLAHRLVQMWVTGEMPELVVHHKNNVRHCNTWKNLAQVSTAQNNASGARLKAHRGKAKALYAN